MPKVIGQGSYGCIHKPSLHCKESKPDDFYEDRLSKLMLTESATKELAEYTNVMRADPNNDYYTGYPTLCKLNYKLNDKNEAVLSAPDKRSVNKCKMYTDDKKDPTDYRLLILADGGVDLNLYGKNLRKLKPTPKNIKNFEKFWIEAHRLFMGISVFLKHGLVHRDLKPHNIVYNARTNRLNYIDFGLMRKITDMRRGLSKRWFNYPPEINYYDPVKFRIVTEKPETEIIRYVANENVERHNAQHLQTFMLFVLGKDNQDKDKADEFFREYIKGCYETILGYSLAYGRDAWDQMAEKSFETFDIYGLGMSLLYTLNMGEHLLGSKVKDGLKDILLKMVSSNVEKRPDIKSLIEMYEGFLKDSGLLDNHNKKVENNAVVVGSVLPNKVVSEIENITLNKVIRGREISKADAASIAEKTPPTPKPCPEGKEFNPSTRRCLLKCKTGTERSPKTQRCMLNCKEEYKRNPSTRRCLLKCKEGYERSSKTQRCMLTCKAGYERNPKTMRCIKVKSLPKSKVYPKGKKRVRVTQRVKLSS